MKNEDVKRAFIANSSSTFKGYYYEGSDNSFHYFVAKWDFQKDHYFKIGRENLEVLNKYIYPKETKETKIDLCVVDGNGELFAENQYYKLYLIK